MRLRTLGGITIALVVGCVVFIHPVRAIGPIVKITISPATVELSAGSSKAFTSQGQDASGATTDFTVNTVFTTTDPLGTVLAATYSPGKAGSWVVTATYNDLSADAQVTVTPGPVKEIAINPNSEPEYVMKGKTRTFTGEAFDAFNNAVDVAPIEWTIDGDIGSLTAINKTATRFTAKETGSGSLTAFSGDARSTIDIVVTKPVVTNTNANTNAATTNKNASANASNANSNTNSETIVPVNENTNASPSSTTSSSCKAWSRSVWLWIFIGYLVLLMLSLYPIRKMRLIWWWVAPLILTIAALWIYFQFRCYPVYPALPYLILLGGIIATSWYNWQRTAPPVQRLPM
ncbi:MAG: hypothetical protein V1907_02315 [Candidatus Kerfeldbacteria bacterium]